MSVKANDQLPHAVFDTRNFAPSQRFDAWRSSIGVIFETVLTDSQAAAPFNARVDIHAMGHLLLGQASSDPIAFKRSEHQIISDGIDHYLVQIVTAGGSEVGHREPDKKMRPGDIYVFDAAAPLDGTLFAPTNHIAVIVPREIIANHLPPGESLHCHVVPRELPLARLLRGYVHALEAARSELSVADGVEAAGPVLSLLGNVLSSRAGKRPVDADPGTINAAVLRMARDFIEAQLADPALSPAVIATAMGLSRTQLYRLFEPLGGVADYVRKRRLRRSLQDLLDQSHRSMLISEIGFRWGFSSESQYSRAFRQFYGCSPREAREARVLRFGNGTRQENVETYARWLRDLAG